MKRFKIIFIILSSLAALVALAVVLAFTPAVQTWAVRRVLVGQPGLAIEVGRVAAGLTSAELRDVRVVQDGTVIVVKEIAATYSATDYLSGKKINVGNVALHGVEVDTRKSTAKPTTPPAAAAVAPFAGVLNAIRLPGEIRVGHVEVDAKVLLPANQTVAVTLTGGGIAPGQFGTLTWKVDFTDATKAAPLAAAQASGEIKLRTTADLRVDSIEVNADAGATGPALPKDRVKLALKLEQPSATAGESIVARVSLVRGTTVEPLLNAKVDYVAGKPVMNGVWDLAVRSEQFAAMLAGLGLPELALTGKGSFTYHLDTGAAVTAGEITSTISKLEKLGAELAAIGSLQVHAAFDGGASKESAQLGKLDFDVATAAGRKFITLAVLQKLSVNLKTKNLTAERPGAELARVSILSVPLAWAQPFLKPRTISGDVSGVFVVNAELDGSRVKLSAAEPLTLRAITVSEGGKPLVDRVTVSLSPTVDYTATRVLAQIEKLSVSAPDGDNLSGGLKADVTLGGPSPVIAFSAELKGRLAALVKPYLPADVGPLTLALNAEGRHDGKIVQLSGLKLKVDREGGVALASIETLQAITIDPAKQAASAANAASPALRVRWGGIPLGWAEPYVAKSKISGQLVAGGIDVTLLGADAVSVKATEPIAAKGISVAMNGQQMLAGADFSTDLNATWKAGTLTADIKQLELKQGTASVLKALFTGDVTPPAAGKNKGLVATGHGQVDADFSILGKQPALANQLPLVKGTVSAKFDGTSTDLVKGKVTITAKDLVAREGALALGNMDLTVDAALDANNSGTVKNTLVVTKDGRRSDLTVEGKVGLKPGAISFDGKITGDQLIVDDLQAFSALGAPPPADVKAQTTPAAGTKPVTAPAPRPGAPAPAVVTAPKPIGPIKDTTPLWAGFTGHIDLAIKAIKQGPGVTLAKLGGGGTLRPVRLAVENVGGQFNGNPFKISTLLTFDVKQARPYSLTGAVDVPNFDVGEFLRKADPSTPPALETKITISTKFNGTFANVGEAADRVNGQFDLKGTKGVLRALNKKAETTSAVTGLLGIAAGLAGQSRLASGLAGTAELTAAFKDLQFDSFSAQAERGSDGAVVVKSVEFLSPIMRMTSNGRVDSKPGVPFGTSPLSLHVQIAGKGTLANALNAAHQLSGKTDEKGYYTMATPFTMGGTVDKPDSSEFWKNLTVNTGASFLR
jgi:hypothetical protein